LASGGGQPLEMLNKTNARETQNSSLVVHHLDYDIKIDRFDAL
jgi:hypothetical protein